MPSTILIRLSYTLVVRALSLSLSPHTLAQYVVRTYQQSTAQILNNMEGQKVWAMCSVHRVRPGFVIVRSIPSQHWRCAVIGQPLK